MKVFVSYPDERLDEVRTIVRYLDSHGIDTWFAERDIQPGVDYAQAIGNAIESCGALLVVFCKEADSSPGILRELHLADQVGIEAIYPLRLDHSAPHNLGYLLAGRQWVDYCHDPNTALDRLIRTISLKTGTKDLSVVTLTASAIASTNPAPYDQRSLLETKDSLSSFTDDTTHSKSPQYARAPVSSEDASYDTTLATNRRRLIQNLIYLGYQQTGCSQTGGTSFQPPSSKSRRVVIKQLVVRFEKRLIRYQRPAWVRVKSLSLSTEAEQAIALAGSPAMLADGDLYRTAAELPPSPLPKGFHITGTATVTSQVSIRSHPSAAADMVGVAPAGSKVSLTGSSTNGWARISWDGKPAYVATSCLTRITKC